MKEIFKLTGSLDVIVYLTETSVVSIFIVEMISRRTKFFNDCKYILAEGRKKANINLLTLTNQVELCVTIG